MVLLFELFFKIHVEIIVLETYHELSRVAAEIVAESIRQAKKAVLGLATGSTPIGLYKELIARYQQEEIDFSDVVAFNLDEYVGLEPQHPQSYHYFMEKHLFGQINIPTEQRYIPPSDLSDLQAIQRFCQWYEDEIQRHGGIDLQVLGIGVDGHIGFNESSSSLTSRTRLKTLAQSTVEANAKFFDKNIALVPKLSITMGVGTIMEAKRCLLLANGERKAEAVANAIEGPITASVPASILQMHPNTTILLDNSAAQRLERLDYYKWVYQSKQQLESQL